jgi:hypothetical protein
MALPKLNTARYETTIPSTGRAVEYRPYLVKEEKILMIALESQDQKAVLRAVKDVIESCVFDKINVNNLAIFDVESLFLSLRSKSVGEGVDVNIKCEKCEGENQYKVDLEEIAIPDIGEQDKNIMLTDGVGVTMRYPSFKDMEGIGSEELESVKGVMKLITNCIDSVYDKESVYKGSDQSKEEMNDFIENLNSEQFKKLSDWFEGMPSISHTIEFDCISCKAENKQILRGLQSFFT